MQASVLLASLRRRRYSTFGWMAGMIAIGLLMLAAYPILRENEAVEQLMRRLPLAMLKLFGIDPDLFLTGVGFVEAQLYTLLAPLVLSMMTILLGAAATAREEERGTIDLLLAQPLRRSRLVLEQFLAIALLAAVVTAALGATLALGNGPSGLRLTARGIFGINLGLWLLAMLFGTLSMAVGAWLGRPTVAAGAAAGVALLAFFWNGLTLVFEPLRGLGHFGPFHWYLLDHPALVGPTRGHLILACGSLLLLGAACLLFARRDLGTTVAILRVRRRRRTARSRPDKLLGSIYGREMRLRQFTILWWMLALYGMAAMLIAFWPTLRESPIELESIIKLVPEEIFVMFGIGDPRVMLTPAGFLSSRLYATMGPILMIAFAIAAGTASIAGEERRGTLDLLAAQPISRDRIVTQKFLGLASWVLFLPFGLIGVLFIGNLTVDLGLTGKGIVCANIGLALIALLFGALAFAVGCATGRPALARGIAATAAIASFLLNGLGAVLSMLAPLRVLSPFNWLLGDTPPLARGLPATMLFAPALTAVFFAWGLLAFRRRDLGT